MRKTVYLFIFILIILGFKSAKSADSFHFTFPSNDDILVAGSDTLITWDGIAPSDSVRIEYSLDNGKTWILLSPKAVELNYNWKNLPQIVGNGYLIRLIHIGERVNKLDAPFIEWKNTYGGSKDDYLYDIEELKEGGFIAIGSTQSSDYDISLNNGEADIWLLKVDSNGKVIFSKTYGGSSWEEANFVRQTKDGGFLLGGFTYSNDFDFISGFLKISNFLIKLDKNGYIEWKNTYGNESIRNRGFSDIQETDDGGYILIGEASYNNNCGNHISTGFYHLYILKVDIDGNSKWSKTYGGNADDWGSSIEKTKDGGYVISGCTESECGDIIKSHNIDKHSSHDAFILKLDKNGNFKWQKAYGDSLNNIGNSIKQLKNGDYLLLGESESSNIHDIGSVGKTTDIWIDRTNVNGDIVWHKTYGGSDYDWIYWFSKFSLTTDEGFIFTGVTKSIDGDITHNYGDFDGWFVKIDTNGNMKYQRTFGGSARDYFAQTHQTSDKGYIICGQSYSSDGDIDKNKGGGDGWIVKLGVNYQLIDTVTTTFSIVASLPQARDVDMGKVYVGEWRDSTVAEFVYNIGDYKFRVDSIYFTGTDKSAFTLIGGFPKYTVQSDSGKEARFRFTPTRVGMHYAKIVIVTQADTLIRSIIGEGLKKKARIQTTAEPFPSLVCDNSTNTTVVLKSTGNDPLIIKELNIIGSDKSDFSINEPLPINIAPDSSKTITIGFKTKIPGIRTATLEIKSNADPDSLIAIPLIARKDSVALVPNPTLIDLGVLFPNQTKDTSFIISNFGTIKTDGKVTFTSNISCTNPTFTIDSGGVYKLDFSFTGLTTDGNINEKITVWDEVCKYSREVMIIGKVLAPDLQGFSAIQCKSYENDCKLTLQNPSSNRLQITSIVIVKNPQFFEIDPSLGFPITIEPYSTNYEIKVTYKDAAAQKFSTAVNCFTDNKNIPVITDTIYAETVEYIRTTSGLINDTISDASNPFAVSYDSESQNGKNKFTYSIQVIESANDMDYLTELSDLEIVINYNRNVLGADFDTQSGNLKVRIGDDLKSDYSIKSVKETKIDEFNSQIIVNIENIGKPIPTKNAYKLLEIDFSAYLSNFGLSDEQNSEKSRSAVISHTITTTDECISYETANNALLSIEKLCTDDIRSIKMSNDSSAKFYLGSVIPHPIGTKGATIEYGLGFECQVTLTIYDLAGTVILIPINEIQKAGIHKQTISSKSISAGAYFIEMKAGPFKETKRVIVE